MPVTYVTLNHFDIIPISIEPTNITIHNINHSESPEIINISNEIISNNTNNSISFNLSQDIEEVLIDNDVQNWNLKDQLLLYEICYEPNLTKQQKLIDQSPQHIKIVYIELLKLLINNKI